MPAIIAAQHLEPLDVAGELLVHHLVVGEQVAPAVPVAGAGVAEVGLDRFTGGHLAPPPRVEDELAVLVRVATARWPRFQGSSW